MPGSRHSAILPSFPLWKQDEVDVLLYDRKDGKFVNSYTNLDKISGQVWIKCAKDTPFQDVEIFLEGITETYLEKVATSAPITGQTCARHRFLRLMQPIDPARLPEDDVARAGVPYNIPFEFVVPDQLLDQQCTHQVNSPQVHQAHLQVPPSFGDPMLVGVGETLRDDLAPEMTKVQYRIKARLIKTRAIGTKCSNVVEKVVKLRIAPGKEADPPLDVGQESKDFKLRKEKDFRKGLFKSKIGRVTAEAQQPSGFHLPTLRDQAACPISTMTTVYLRFDPVEEKTRPPTLGSIVSKLRAETYFASVPFRDIPSRTSLEVLGTQHGLYVLPIELSSLRISSVGWHRHDPTVASGTTLSRRQGNQSDWSIGSTDFTPAPSSAYQPGTPFYTAKVLVPMSLPPNKVFTPTFHACLVSRSYVLELNISYHIPGATGSTSSVQLRLPVQISAAGNPDAMATISAEDAEAIVAREVDQEMAEGGYAPISPARPTPVTNYIEGQPPVSVLPASRIQDGSQSTSMSTDDPPVYSSNAWSGPHLRGGSIGTASMAALRSTRASSVSVK